MNWFSAYLEAFSTSPFFAEPSNVVIVEDDNGVMYNVDEPESATVDRIRRSVKAGRNLFYEELPQYDPYPQKTSQY